MNVLFIVIVIMEILSGIEVDLCIPSFPEIQGLFKTSTIAIEGLLSINLLTNCVGALIAGTLGDRYGRKPIIMYGLALFIFGSAICAMASNYTMLLIGRFIQGFGISCPACLAYVIIPDTYDVKTHQKMLGLLNFYATASMAVAPVIGSHIALYFGWRGNFSFCLLCGIVCFILGYFILPPGKRNANLALGLGGYLTVLKNRKVVFYILTICFFVIGYWIFIGMAPILYCKDFGVQLKHFGFYQGALAATLAIVSLLSERLITYFGQNKCFWGSVAMICISIVSIVLLVATNTSSPGLITVAMMLYVGGSVCPVNILCPYAYKTAPEDMGKLNALIMAFKMMAISLLIQATSSFYSGNFRSIGIVVALTLVLVIFLSWRLLKMDSVLDGDYTNSTS
ncbi:MAG: MFS transporter [Holosporales bacterium]|jgi:DHA1 family bicyclomycin/chloramphenicol resistance-like MFS transporter|nr:MFS transporter [Holosporales bacterium]